MVAELVTADLATEHTVSLLCRQNTSLPYYMTVRRRRSKIYNLYTSLAHYW